MGGEFGLPSSTDGGAWATFGPAIPIYIDISCAGKAEVVVKIVVPFSLGAEIPGLNSNWPATFKASIADQRVLK